MKPRIFISAVSKELRSARQLVANTLVALGYEPVWQDIFDTSGEDIRSMLRGRIDSCSAVLQIVGDAYGAEPPTHDEEFGRVSYTQYEALYARSISKRIYYLIASNELPRDAEAESIDLPLDDSDSARADADQRRKLQRDYLASIQSTGHIYYAVQSNSETELAVRRLKDELNRLRRSFKYWMAGVTAALVLIALGIIWLSGGLHDLLISVKEGQKSTSERIAAASEKTKQDVNSVLEKVDKELADHGVLAERIREEIRVTAEKKIKSLADGNGRGRKISEIEHERDLAISRVDDLVKLIQEELKEEASPVFQRAVVILQQEGADDALVYLESRREATMDDARCHAQQANLAQARAEAEKDSRNKCLQVLVLEAQLLASKLQSGAALKLCEQVAELAPDWFEAKNGLGVLQLELARFQPAEASLRSALKLAATADQETMALNNLALLLKNTNRYAEAEPLYRRALAIDEQSYGAEHSEVATDLNNLAQLFQDTNRLAEAEPLMRRALAIDELHYGAEHPAVASHLNNLAMLLQDTNRLAEAELLMRRALAIDEQFYGAEHPNVAIRLNNLALLLRDTNRLVEAELLMRRSLAIDEQSYGAEHPTVATGLNNLALLLKATNRYAAAEPLMRRALATDEQSYGAEHPIVAIDLNNMALLLQATNRLAAAEPLMRRALAIFEQSYGAEHPKVAAGLSNLAQLLQDTNRSAEAEPLVRRALTIGEQSYGAEHPTVAIRLSNLAQLLQDTNRSAEAEPLMRRALTIGEQLYGAEHPTVAIRLSNLAQLLQATNRYAAAEPLMRRAVTIFTLFQRRTGHEHPISKATLDNYVYLLRVMKLKKENLEERLKDAKTVTTPLKPIVPEVERLLGPAKPVAEALAELDREYRAEGKPPVYFLPAKEPMAPHLDALLKPTADTLDFAGLGAYRHLAYADAIVLYDEALSLHEDKADSQQLNLTIRINRADARRSLGDVEQACTEIQSLLPDLDNEPSTTAKMKGRARYQLALCKWQLGDNVAAKSLVEESLEAYGDTPDVAPFRRQIEQLLADLNDSKPPAPLPTLDAKIEVESARARYRSRSALASLPTNQSALLLLDQILGPTKSTQEALDELDRQYREASKTEISFLPLSEPISPHLDEILEPMPNSTTLETR